MKIDKDELLDCLNTRADNYRDLVSNASIPLAVHDDANIKLNELIDLINLIKDGSLDEITKNIDLDVYYDAVEEQYRRLHIALLNATKHDEFANIKSITEAILMTAEQLKCVRERSVANER